MRNRNRSEPFEGKSRGRRRGARPFVRKGLAYFVRSCRVATTSAMPIRTTAHASRPSRYTSGGYAYPTVAKRFSRATFTARETGLYADSTRIEPTFPRGGAAATKRLPRLGPRGTRAAEEAGTGNLNIPPS